MADPDGPQDHPRHLLKSLLGRRYSTIEFPEKKRNTSGRDRRMARAKLVEYGPGYRPEEHDVRRPVRIAALERLKAEHGIVPGMPGERR